MTDFNVALLQILPTGSQEANLIKGLEYCKKAKQMGADISLFPEMWNIGYALTPDREEAEGIYIARFPIEELREYRKREIHGNAYRRPDKYHLLISEEKAEPFIRKSNVGDFE